MNGGRDVRVEPVGGCGMKVSTPEYTDYVFLGDELVEEDCGDVRFVGRAGWIRRGAAGEVEASLPDGELIEAFGAHSFR